jgi:hypothetical protein
MYADIFTHDAAWEGLTSQGISGATNLKRANQNGVAER